MDKQDSFREIELQTDNGHRVIFRAKVEEAELCVQEGAFRKLCFATVRKLEEDHGGRRIFPETFFGKEYYLTTIDFRNEEGLTEFIEECRRIL